MKIDQEDLEMLADLECDDDGPLVVDGEVIWSAYEVDQEGIDKAITDNVCPLCGEELSPTLDAAIDMLKLVAERFPEMGDEIAKRVSDALGGEGSE